MEYNRAMLMAIRPEWVVKILNGEKTIEVRKKFPKDYVGWVYIYCSKSKPYLYGDKSVYEGKQEYFWVQKIEGNGIVPLLNGKVVARFWCDKVEEVFTPTYVCEDDNYYSCDIYKLLKESCLTEEQLLDYIGEDNYHFFAIHISKLEIFDKPRELSEFRGCSLGWNNCIPHNCKECPCSKPLTKAPQNCCYIEGE